MDFLYNLVVVLHFLGLAALIGGYLVAAVSAARPNSVMVWGARLQVLTGLIIVGLGEGAGVWDAQEGDPNHMKIGIKLVIALAVVALTEISSGKAKKGQSAPALVHAAGGLAVVNVLVAVFMAGFVS